MNGHNVAAGLFKLAKAHRGRAMEQRQEANGIAYAYRGERAEQHIAHHRELAAEEDAKAAFYRRAAQLAKVGAEMEQCDEDVAKSRNWSFGFQTFGRIFFASFIVSKLKGTGQ